MLAYLMYENISCSFTEKWAYYTRISFTRVSDALEYMLRIVAKKRYNVWLKLPHTNVFLTVFDIMQLQPVVPISKTSIAIVSDNRLEDHRHF